MRHVVRLNDTPLYDAPVGVPPRSVGALIDTLKADELTMGLFVLPPGQKSVIDYHDQDEAYFLTRGAGSELLWLHGENKDPEKFEIEAGSAVLVPKYVRHQMVNTGNEPIWLVWFFPRHPTGGDDATRHFSSTTWIKKKMPIGEWYPRH
jgi:oxalate decarboxylase/phosphoglucose isomerase-like protein (cupin superfamily)